MQRLAAENWNLEPDKTKILMLTHNVLAAEQGYSNLARVFPYNDAYIKKDDPYIAFFDDILEPVCAAYKSGHFGKMFEFLGGRTPTINSLSDKVDWARDMDSLLSLRETDTIGAVLDHLFRSKRPRLPEYIERKQQELIRPKSELTEDELSAMERLQHLRDVRYQEVIALTQFIDGHTPFSTKHGVKGTEFENVVVVVGRGWNKYDFNQLLEWVSTPPPNNRQEAF